MTLPVQFNPISLGGTSSPVSVAYELGLSLTATISLNDPAVRTLAGVGASPAQISMNNLHGKSSFAVTNFTGGPYAYDGSSPYNATATVWLNTDGTISTDRTPSSSGDLSPKTWADGAPITNVGVGKWVRCTVTAGSLTSGTTNEWLQLNTGPSWSRNRTSVGLSDVYFTLDFALSAGGAVIASRPISLSAECGNL